MDKYFQNPEDMAVLILVHWNHDKPSLGYNVHVMASQEEVANNHKWLFVPMNYDLHECYVRIVDDI